MFDILSKWLGNFNLILVKILFLINNTILLFSGLFLFLQVIAPLHVRMVKLRHYTVIGWGKCFDLSIFSEFSSVCVLESKYKVCTNRNELFFFLSSVLPVIVVTVWAILNFLESSSSNDDSKHVSSKLIINLVG